MVTVKHIDTRIKSAPDGSPDVTPEGTFTGYASVFGNVDSYGDVVMKGAFSESLAAQSTFPVYWSHQMSDPMMNIGKTTKVYEDDHGLFVEAQLDLDTPMGAQVYRLIKDGRVSQMSFAFDVEDYKVAPSPDGGGAEVVELHRLKLHEVSIVQVGANQATELLDVKHRVERVKSDRRISDEDVDRLSKALDLIESVIQDAEEDVIAAGDDTDDDGEDDAAKAADPTGESTSDGTKARRVSPDAALASMYLTIMEGGQS